MSGRAGPLAVQISDPGVHQAGGSQSGLWGIAIMTIGLALICYGAVPTVRVLQWRAQAWPAPGRVVDNVPRASLRGSTRWQPLVEFEADGRAVVCLIQSLAKRGGWPLGHDIDVLYDPSNPHRARAANAGLNVSGWLLLGVAVIGTFLAIVT
jgi:hypothetical protein